MVRELKGHGQNGCTSRRLLVKGRKGFKNKLNLVVPSWKKGVCRLRQTTESVKMFLLSFFCIIFSLVLSSPRFSCDINYVLFVLPRSFHCFHSSLFSFSSLNMLMIYMEYVPSPKVNSDLTLTWSFPNLTLNLHLEKNMSLNLLLMWRFSSLNFYSSVSTQSTWVSAEKPPESRLISCFEADHYVRIANKHRWPKSRLHN